ncbi:MAG: hypothetical protein DRQ47_01775 [Gammaproteobacteria bacterium]|nr:MAG: hypothetical protein DRQ47_01775 [Gammaproteobacteria bacterium]
MNKRKSILQKSSAIIGKICFLLAALCVAVLYFKVKELGMQHVISASFLASSFFFVFVGFVLTVIGNADIPSFKVGSVSRTQKDNSEENI